MGFELDKVVFLRDQMRYYIPEYIDENQRSDKKSPLLTITEGWSEEIVWIKTFQERGK